MRVCCIYALKQCMLLQIFNNIYNNIFLRTYLIFQLNIAADITGLNKFFFLTCYIGSDY